jgi:SRSO17 transposase
MRLVMAPSFQDQEPPENPVRFTLVMLAFAMMATVRHHANSLPPPKTKTRARQSAL